MTQRQALKFIREETGLSYEATASLVRSMPTRRDGKREKVFHSDVIAAVTDALRPSEIATVKPMRPMRPIKQSQRDRVDLSKLKRRDEWPSIAI